MALKYKGVVVNNVVFLNNGSPQFVNVKYGSTTVHTNSAFEVTSSGIKVKSGVTLSGEVTIPSTFGGRRITTIAPSGFYGQTFITSVKICDGITTIGDDAFNGCTGLTTVDVPDSVLTIGDSCFNACHELTSVTGCSGLQTIARAAFNMCISLRSFPFKPALTTLGSGAFFNCTNLDISSCLADTSVRIFQSDTFRASGSGQFPTNTVALPQTTEVISADAFDGIQYADVPRGTWHYELYDPYTGDLSDEGDVNFSNATSSATMGYYVTGYELSRIHTAHNGQFAVSMDTSGFELILGITLLGYSSGGATITIRTATKDDPDNLVLFKRFNDTYTMNNTKIYRYTFSPQEVYIFSVNVSGDDASGAYVIEVNEDYDTES